MSSTATSASRKSPPKTCRCQSAPNSWDFGAVAPCYSEADAGRHRNTVEIAVILLPATRTIGHVWKMRNPEYPRLARRDSP